MAATTPTTTVPTPDGVLLIDANEVARRLGLSVRTIWRLNSAGKLPSPVPIGGKSKRWRAEEITTWVAAGCPARPLWEAVSKKPTA